MGTVVADRFEEQVQDAKALRDEQQVPDRIEERDRALDLSRGHGLTLDGGELVTQLDRALLELVARSSSSAKRLVAWSRPRGNASHG